MMENLSSLKIWISKSRKWKEVKLRDDDEQYVISRPSQRVFHSDAAIIGASSIKWKVWWKLHRWCRKKRSKIFRKVPKINLCYPQNESNKTSFALVPLFCTHSFEWQGGLYRFFLVGCYFWTRRRLFSRLLAHVAAVFPSSSRSWKRVFKISEIKRLFTFGLFRSACLGSEKKLLILDIPPVHASECVVIYAFLSLHISWRARKRMV